MPLLASIRLILVAVLLGVAVGALIALIRVAVYDVLWAVLPQDRPAIGIFPAIGMLLSGLLLRHGAARTELHDTEAYIATYHSGRVDSWRAAMAKTGAALCTVGFGGAAGLEGPSMYVGSTLGGWLRPVLARFGIRDPRAARSLLVAGAAAGISAIFKAPLTGLFFALEVPYTNDFAREALVPALVASVSSYLTLVSILGPELLFPVNRGLSPSIENVLLALALGTLLGGAARLLALVVVRADQLSRGTGVPLPVRTLGGGVVCGLLGVVSLRLYGVPLALGSGHELVNASVVGGYVGATALVLLLVRTLAVAATLGSGAAGGTFIPFMSIGAVAGGFFEGLAPATGALFPVVGMAAFLGVANATPVAAAVFVAESTGSAGYIIPGLVAATAAYLVGGGRTISESQRPGSRRTGDVR